MNLTTHVDEYQPSFIQSMGSAHAVSSDAPVVDVVAALRAVVEEVTRKPLPQAARVPMGFLP